MSLIIFTFKKLRAKKNKKFSFHFGGLSREKNLQKLYI